MPRLLTWLDTVARRCWLAWRYVRALGYPLPVAWAKARRLSS